MIPFNLLTSTALLEIKHILECYNALHFLAGDDALNLEKVIADLIRCDAAIARLIDKG